MLKVDINRYLIRSNPILEGQIEAKLVFLLFYGKYFEIFLDILMGKELMAL